VYPGAKRLAQQSQDPGVAVVEQRTPTGVRCRSGRPDKGGQLRGAGPIHEWMVRG